MVSRKFGRITGTASTYRILVLQGRLHLEREDSRLRERLRRRLQLAAFGSARAAALPRGCWNSLQDQFFGSSVRQQDFSRRWPDPCQQGGIDRTRGAHTTQGDDLVVTRSDTPDREVTL